MNNENERWHSIAFMGAVVIFDMFVRTLVSLK